MSEFQNQAQPTEKGYTKREPYLDVNPYTEPRFDGTSGQQQYVNTESREQQKSETYVYGQSYYDPQNYVQPQDYTQQGYVPSQGYMCAQPFKQSANVCSIIGFVLGLPSFLGYLFYIISLFGSIHGSQLMARLDNVGSVFGSIFAVIFTPFMAVGPLPAFVLGIVSVCLSGNPLQVKRERARVFGIFSIVFAVLSCILLVLFIAMAVDGLNQVYSQYA